MSPDPAVDWPEGVTVARLYAAAYGMSLQAALELVFDGPVKVNPIQDQPE